MGKSENPIEGFSSRLSITRRGFVKSVAAAGTVVALYGCSKDENGDIIYGGGSEISPETPAPLESVFVGTAPHNCGGGACVLKAHVSDGVIKRFSTDERPDGNMVNGNNPFDAQRRGCVRCRSKKEWYYRKDRLLYPLKQTKARGDLTGFKRITWKQAYQETANEIKRIADTYGPESFHKFYSTGDGAQYPRSREFSANILFKLGGEYSYRDDYSYPSWYTAGYFTWGNTFPGSNDAPDFQFADLIVLWSANISEMIANCNASWYVTQARDLGVPVISVDQRISKTASTLSTGAGAVPPVIAPVGGTDAALVAAMLYHLISKHIEAKEGADIWSASLYLDPKFISQHIHGFFDTVSDPAEYSYRTVTNLTYPVPAGASYSAYIFGDDAALVTAGLNGKVSVYPNQIGYNVGDIDIIKGKYAPCYGQVPKTPEWAEKITGVPAATIRAFAELIAATDKVTILHDGGFQRHTEGEQSPRSLMVLAAVTKCFGRNGASFGKVSGNAGSVGDALPKFTGTGAMPWADTNLKANIEAGTNLHNPAGSGFAFSARYDASKVTDVVSKKDGLNSFPVFMWQDAIEKGSNNKSRWGVPEIANGPAMKLIFNFGGNCVANQCGDYNLTTSILSLPNKQAAIAGQDDKYPNRKYQLELLITTDHFMTASAQWSDYVLPAAMSFEKAFYKSAGDAVHYSPKAINPPADVRSDFEMTLGIADALGALGEGFNGSNLTTDGIRDEDQLLRKAYAAPVANPEIDFDEFKKRGVITSGYKGTINVVNKAFYDDPKSNPLVPTAYTGGTPTGKVEAYSQGMVEFYEARLFNNYDPSVMLINGEIVTAAAATGSQDAKKGRIVYPIPMYIPSVEGRHACDDDSAVPAFDGTASGVINKSVANGATRHPDLTGSNAKDYKFRLHCWHMQYRSHSTLNSNAYLNELYKVDKDGNPTFYALDRGQEKVYGDNGAIVDTNVYEPVFISPKTADKIAGFDKTNGNRVLIYNDHGALYAYARVSELVQYGEIMIGQGAWTQTEETETAMPTGGKSHKIDIGGNANSVMGIRPSRICQGMTLSNDCKVGIVVR